jgi:hypothetical protein
MEFKDEAVLLTGAGSGMGIVNELVLLMGVFWLRSRVDCC